MKIGLDAYTVRELKLSPHDLLEYAYHKGFEGVQFEFLRDMSPSLSLSELTEIKNHATRLNMYIYITVSQVNPIINEMTESTLYERLVPEIEVASRCGWHEVRSNLGVLRHRKESNGNWNEHIQTSINVLKRLKPVLQANGVRINLETHSDSTSWELLSVIDSVGDDVVGITLDTGNLLLHGEYPPEVIKRIGKYVHLTHAKDGLLFSYEEGYFRQGCEPGKGVVPWETVVSQLHTINPQIDLSIEDHKNIHYIPVCTSSWYNDHPNASAYEIATLMRLASQTDERLRAGELMSPFEYEKIPYLEQADERLENGLKYLKSLCSKLSIR